MRRILSIFLPTVIVFIFLVVPSPAHALNRIGVRQGSNGGEFYDTVTNSKIQFRGNNYIVLGDQFDPLSQTTLHEHHILFDPGKYNSSIVQATLDQFKRDGYNSVRIFISFINIGNPTGGLSPEHMDNIADFMKRADANNLYVFPALAWLPGQGGYYPASSSLTDQMEHPNIFFMSQPYIDAKKRYLQDFITELRKRNVPTQIIVGYEIENEILFYLDKKPFSQTSGIIQTATGPYDMANADQRNQSMNANLVNWSDQVRTAIKQIEPEALVTVSLFPPTAIPLLQMPSVSSTYWMFVDPDKGGSSIDFVDLHPYPWIGTLQKQMTDHLISSSKKPIILGEFGALKPASPTNDDLIAAITTMRDWQVQSCQYNFQGWFTWAWGNGANITGFYSVEESSGALDSALAPIARQDPCKSEGTTPSPSPALKPGDLNGDGHVNLYDYTELVRGYGTLYTDDDFINVLSNYGK